MYTQDYDQTVPLTEVFDRIHQKHGKDLAITNKSDDRDLSAFMADIMPDYDRERVYMSDIKKLVQWYHVVSKKLDYQAPATEDEAPAAEATEEKPKAKKKAAKKVEPAADEALSTAGIIPAAEETNAAGNPEAGEAKPAKKTTKKKAE